MSAGGDITGTSSNSTGIVVGMQSTIMRAKGDIKGIVTNTSEVYSPGIAFGGIGGDPPGSGGPTAPEGATVISCGNISGTGYYGVSFFNFTNVYVKKKIKGQSSDTIHSIVSYDCLPSVKTGEGLSANGKKGYYTDSITYFRCTGNDLGGDDWIFIPDSLEENGYIPEWCQQNP